MARNTKSQMSKILSCQDKSEITARGPGGVLSRLFQTILIDLQITNAKWDTLMYDYMNDPRNKMPKDRNVQTSRRGNLTGELSDVAMTWKTFCMKAMRVLQFTRIEITIRAFHRHGGKITEHSVGVDLVNPQDEALFKEVETTAVTPVVNEVPINQLKGLDQ